MSDAYQLSALEDKWLQTKDQEIRASDREWRMDDRNHSISRKEKGRVLFAVGKGRIGQMHISITEYGKRERKLRVCLKPYVLQSLVEWLKAGDLNRDPAV